METPVEAGEQSHSLAFPFDPALTACSPFSGDTINLIGDFDTKSTPSLTVSRLTGLLILHPDILVSSTKVGDSAYCARKALLQEIVRTVGGSTPSLAYGNMLHELMQACMTEGRWEDAWRESKIDEIVAKEVQTLWAMDVQVEKARESMREKTKAFGEFKEVFMGGKQPKVSPHLCLPLSALR
jgi:DNA replication ATP-dependent helicase Dna2